MMSTPASARIGDLIATIRIRADSSGLEYQEITIGRVTGVKGTLATHYRPHGKGKRPKRLPTHHLTRVASADVVDVAAAMAAPCPVFRCVDDVIDWVSQFMRSKKP